MKEHAWKLAACIVCLSLGLALAEPPAAGQPTSKPTATTSAPAGNPLQGLLVAKGEDWVSVKATGQSQGTRFSTTDKEIIAAIAKLTIPSQVKVAWKEEGGARRIVSLQTVTQVSTAGEVEGSVTNKGDNWIEVKPAEGEAERYVTIGEAKDVKAAIADVKVGDKVRVTWKFAERKRVMKLEKIGAGQ